MANYYTSFWLSVFESERFIFRTKGLHGPGYPRHELRETGLECKNPYIQLYILLLLFHWQGIYTTINIFIFLLLFLSIILLSELQF